MFRCCGRVALSREGTGFEVERVRRAGWVGDVAGPSTAGLAKCASPFAQDDKFGVG